MGRATTIQINNSKSFSQFLNTSVSSSTLRALCDGFILNDPCATRYSPAPLCVDSMRPPRITLSIASKCTAAVTAGDTLCGVSSASRLVLITTRLTTYGVLKDNHKRIVYGELAPHNGYIRREHQQVIPTAAHRIQNKESFEFGWQRRHHI